MAKSAGQWIGTVVGAVIGFFIPGGYVALGAAIGGMIGGAIDPPKGPDIRGPRLSDLNVQTSSYGVVIPRVYGTVALTGNVFWIENNKLAEHEKTEEQGGKGGGGGATATSYWYSATFALGLCEGPITSVRRIWVSGKLIYDAGASDTESQLVNMQNLVGGLLQHTLGKSDEGGVAQGGKSFTLYTGSETQAPNARMEATLGAGNVPGYRGLAYLVFEDFDLTDYGNSLMGAQFKVEVVSNGVASIAYNTVNTIPENYENGASRNMLCAILTPTYVDYIAVTNLLAPEYMEVYRAEYGVYQRLVSKVAIDFVPNISAYPQNYYVAQSDRLVAIFGHGNEPGDITHWGFVGLESSGAEFMRSYESISIFSSNVGVVVVEGTAIISAGGGVKVSRFDGPVLTAQSVSTYTITRMGYSENYLFAVNSEQVGATTTVYKFDKSSLTLVDTYVQSVPSRYSPIYVVSDTEFYTVSSDTLYRWVDGVAESLGALYQGFASASLRRLWFLPSPYGSVNIQELATGPGDEAVLMAGLVLTPQPVPLSDIVEAECLKSGLLSAGDLDVTALTQDVRGYRVTQVAAIRSGLEPLQGAWPFDIIQDGYQINFLPRGNASVGTVAADDLGASAPGDKDVIQITESREQDSQLARKAVITYLDVSREYDVSEQSAERLNTDAVNVRSIEMPLVLTADEAAQMVERLLYLWWLERRDLTFTLPPTWLHLQPADVVTVQSRDATFEARLAQCQYLPDGRIEVSAKYNDAPVYVSTAVGAEPPYTGQTLALGGSSLVSLLDVPCVDSTYMDTPGLLTGISGYTTGWPGGVLFRSADTGQTWQSMQAFVAPGVAAGYATGVLATGVKNIIDASNSVNVVMLSGVAESVSLATLFAGGNHFAIGVDGRWEIVGVLTATEEIDGSYTLTNLMRGRFGTEQYMSTHAAYDQIVKLDSAKLRLINVNTSDIGISRLWRGVTSGATLDSAEDITHTYNGINIKPLSSIRLNGSRDPATSDWTITAVPRSRTPVEPFSGIATPIGESTESYVVELWDSGYATLKRTISGLSTPTTTYTNAQQVTDFGAIVDTLYVRWFKVSATLGRGYPMQASIYRSLSPDPYIGFNRLLVNCTTNLTDATGRHTVTATGNAAVSGGYCVFDGSGDYLYLDGSSDFAPTGDFTVEMYFTPTSMAETHILFDCRPTSTNGSYLYLDCTTAGTVGFYVASAYRIQSSAGAVVNTTEYHIAVCRSESSNRLFINGTQVGSTWTDSRSYVVGASRPTLITNGADAANTVYHTQCKLRGIRFTACARYTGTFTPPSMPLTES